MNGKLARQFRESFVSFEGCEGDLGLEAVLEDSSFFGHEKDS